jgi:hypothetical protein
VFEALVEQRPDAHTHTHTPLCITHHITSHHNASHHITSHPIPPQTTLQRKYTTTNFSDCRFLLLEALVEQRPHDGDAHEGLPKTHVICEDASLTRSGYIDIIRSWFAYDVRCITPQFAWSITRANEEENEIKYIAKKSA